MPLIANMVLRKTKKPRTGRGWTIRPARPSSRSRQANGWSTSENDRLIHHGAFMRSNATICQQARPPGLASDARPMAVGDAAIKEKGQPEDRPFETLDCRTP
jgi:hypothetical protein